jgi:hypothetical protein
MEAAITIPKNTLIVSWLCRIAAAVILGLVGPLL